MTVTFTYTPADADSVTAVPLVALHLQPERTGTATASAGPAVRLPDGTAYTVELDVPDGTYWPLVSVDYADGSSEQDRTGPALRVPAARVALPGEPLTPWVTVAELQAQPGLAGIDGTRLALWAQAATERLWALSGRQIGGLRQTVETVRAVRCRSHRYAIAADGTLDRGAARLGIYDDGECGCERHLRLGRTPVREVESVQTRGQAVPASAYRVEGDVLLAEPGTLGPDVTVTYVYGREPDASARRACLALAAAYARDDARGGCALPSRTVQAVSEGVTLTFDAGEEFAQGRTGVAVADGWLAAVNPHRAVRASALLAPGAPRRSFAG